MVWHSKYLQDYRLDLSKAGLARTIYLFLMLLVMSPVVGQTLDFSAAVIYSPDQHDPLIKKSIQIFQEEVQKRTALTLELVTSYDANAKPIFYFGLEADITNIFGEDKITAETLLPTNAEGFKILTGNKQQIVYVLGADPRGVLYGTGWLLRKLQMAHKKLQIPQELEVSTSPKYPIRGHQLGYRPKTNSYDAWTVAQFDQYIRELAIFGANSIEIMPPRTDDDFTSVHMQIPAIEMIAAQSEICDSYGLDVWMWYPNLGESYTDPDSLKKELAERRAIFRTIPRLDHLFVPGGDPGDLEPEVLFDWLHKVSEVLHEYHPQAKIWVSPQVFRPVQAWFEVFYHEVNKKHPWFGGVVFGPWVKTPIEEIRAIVDPSIPIRRYPDITHSLSAQYPIPEWDLAFAITLGRECINPRPADQKKIHNRFDEFAQGSISYSEGTNDDVNKFIWSGLDWDPEIAAIDVLRDYARLFIHPDLTEGVSQGLVSLEQNCRGPLLINQNINRCLHQWKDLEASADPAILSNDRFQMGLIRAYFDAYTQRRYLVETALEQNARDILYDAPQLGSTQAVDRARTLLLYNSDDLAFANLKTRCYQLADDLFNSIGAQLTIEKHHAMGGRGNFIDNIDLPVSDAPWLLDQLQKIDLLESENERLKKIRAILHRSDPGPGGFYDDLGSPASWNRIIQPRTWDQDPGSLHTPRVSFGVGLQGKEWVHEITAKGFSGEATPMAWMQQVTALYDQPLKLIYDNLNPEKKYSVKISYTGRFRSHQKLLADEYLLHDFIVTGITPTYEFSIPPVASQDGKIELTLTCGEGQRGAQASEIWIICEN